MCMDEEADHWLVGLLGEESPSTLVVKADARPFPPFTLQQASLPTRVALAHVVPKPGEVGQVPAAEGAGQLTSEFGDAA